MAFVIPAIMGAAAIGSAVVGGISASNAQAAATQARQQALAYYQGIGVPNPTDEQLQLAMQQVVGQLDPKMQAAISQLPTAQSGMSIDGSTRSAQMAALSKLGNITANNGEDAQEKEQIQQGINSVNQNTQGQIGAILQNASARGVGGSGASLAAELQAGQSGANNASQDAMSAQAQASQRALSALSQQGSLAGQIHSQDYNEALNKANATDAINRFNAQNQNSVMAANTNATNQAQAGNLANEQSIANANTGTQNYEQQYNSQLQQQQYQNQLELASGEANAENGVANQYNLNAATTGNMWGNISSGLAGAAGAVYKNNASQYNNSDNGTTNYDPNPEQEDGPVNLDSYN